VRSTSPAKARQACSQKPAKPARNSPPAVAQRNTTLPSQRCSCPPVDTKRSDRSRNGTGGDTCGNPCGARVDPSWFGFMMLVKPVAPFTRTGLARFLDEMARRNGGRVLAPEGDKLGDYVVSDYLRRRSGRNRSA
jgi:hypothetical protein